MTAPDDPAAFDMVAADSWRLSGNRVVALDRHRDRFLRAVIEVAPDPLAVAEPFAVLWQHTVAALQRHAESGLGDGFPRIEAHQSHGGGPLEFRLLQRLAPPRRREVVVASYAGDDFRIAPARKGPDLVAAVAARAALAPDGIHEAVWVSPAGTIDDGLTSAVLAWRDGTLIVPDSSAQIHSITVSVLVDHAILEGIPVVREPVRPEALEGAAIWMVSALHGVQEVSSWIDGPRSVADPEAVGWARASLTSAEVDLDIE